MVKMNRSKPRFIPLQRRALDGIIWWVPWDTERKCWNTYTCFGRYRTKRACQYDIDLFIAKLK